MSQDFRIEPMTDHCAREYLGWKYQPPYDVYNVSPAHYDEAYNDIFHGKARHFTVFSNEEMVGIYQYTLQNGVMEIALGLTPSLTGLGMGSRFVQTCLDFALDRLKYKGNKFILKVAEFNQRAIRVYETLGFKETYREDEPSGKKTIRFVHMEKTMING